MLQLSEIQKVCLLHVLRFFQGVDEEDDELVEDHVTKVCVKRHEIQKLNADSHQAGL